MQKPMVFGIVEHDNLSSSKILPIRWNVSGVPDHLRTSLKSLRAIELRIDNLYDEDKRHEEAVVFCKSIVKGLLKDLLVPAYCFHVEYKPKLPSRVRSYKGIFPYKGTVLPEQVIQKEFPVTNRSTIIAGIARISDSNFEDIMAVLSDFSTSCVIVGDESNISLFSRQYLETLYGYLQIGPTAAIGYPQLVAQECGQGRAVLSLYWMGEDYINTTIFSDQNRAPNVISWLREKVPEGNIKDNN